MTFRFPATVLASALLLLWPQARSLRAAGSPRPVAPWNLGPPAYLDLAGARSRPVPADRAPVATVPLAQAAADEVLSAPGLAGESPAELRNRGDFDPPRKAEKALLAREGAAVRRTGKRLVVTPASGPPLLFEDVHLPARPDADPDGTSYGYAGRVGAGRLHRVVVSFEHDSPGSYLVDPASGRTAFVHEFDDAVVLSPGEKRLVLFNPLNPPFTLVVASISAGGPELELLCRAGGDGRGSAEMKRWTDDATADLVLVLGKKEKAERVPVRLRRTSSGWLVETPDPGRLTRPDGFACFAPQPSTPTRTPIPGS